MNDEQDRPAAAPLSVIDGGRAPRRPRAATGVEYHPPQEAKKTRASAWAPIRYSGPYDEHGNPINEQGHRITLQCPTPIPFNPSRGAPISREERLLWAWQGTPAQDTSPKAVAYRVDWLTVAFKVDLDAKFMSDLTGQLDEDDQARVAATLGAHKFELKRMRSGTRVLCRNADVAIVLDPEGPEGWTVQMDFPGGTMMRTSVDMAVDLARELAVTLGRVKGERVRRLDLCADIANFPIDEISPGQWVKPSRARLQRTSLADVEKPLEQPALLQHRRGKGAAITGYTVCPGNPISCVIYNKREELLAHPEKRAAEEERWTAGGWDGESSVTRVEFRLRSEVLHQLNARDGLDVFRMRLDALWQYCASDWLRLIIPRSAQRLSRCELDPVWKVVRHVRFAHKAFAATRYRIRGGATGAQAFGATLSHLAREARAPELREELTEDGEVLDEAAQVAALDDRAAQDVVLERVRGLFARAGEVIAEDLLVRFGPRRAALFVLHRESAARARFSTTGVEAVEADQEAAA